MRFDSIYFAVRRSRVYILTGCIREQRNRTSKKNEKSVGLGEGEKDSKKLISKIKEVDKSKLHTVGWKTGDSTESKCCR